MEDSSVAMLYCPPLGLNGYDNDGTPLIERQAIWSPPPPKGSRPSPQSEDDLVIFALENCAAAAMVGDTILAPRYKTNVPLVHLVPDLLLTDLMDDLRIDKTQFEFNPKNPANSLGRGGAGEITKSLRRWWWWGGGGVKK